MLTFGFMIYFAIEILFYPFLVLYLSNEHYMRFHLQVLKKKYLTLKMMGHKQHYLAPSVAHAYFLSSFHPK